MAVGEIFELNPGAPKHLDFAAYDEAINGPPLSESGTKKHTIEARFPINPLSSGISYLDDEPYTIMLFASVAESEPCCIECRLWVEDGRLRLERAA